MNGRWSLTAEDASTAECRSAMGENADGLILHAEVFVVVVVVARYYGFSHHRYYY